MKSTGTTPLRSALYIPGSNVRALQKAPGLEADALIFDLEDAVAPDEKENARGHLERALMADFGWRRRAVRVNCLGTPWGAADLAFVAALPAERLDAVVLPKVESVSIIEAARALLPPGVAIWCMIETPRGVLAADSIASAEGVAGLIAGTSDLSKDLRVAPHRSRLPLLYSLSQIVLAARANGRFALDGVCLDLNDTEGFEREARQGRALGFDGKTLIHPKTIEVTNEVFGPSADELAGAVRIVAAFDEALRSGMGVVVVDGRLVESLHVEAARYTLALAESIAARAR